MTEPSPPTREQLLRDLGYSERSIRYIMDGQNLAASPAFAWQMAHVGSCGDMLKLYLDVEDDHIRKATFELTGCAGLQACASGLTTMIEGKTLEEAGRIEVDDIVGFLGGIPEAKWDCAELARDTLRKALKQAAE